MGACASAPEQPAPEQRQPEPARGVGESNSDVFNVQDEEADANFGLTTHTVLKPLGEGGTGETYLCKRKDNGAEEAVKVIKRPLPKMLRELVANEIILQSSIGEGHGNIVKARSVILTKSHICLFLDFVSGGTLTDLVHDRATAKGKEEGLCMDEDEARFLFRQIVEAIDYCHAKDVAHRDVKLDNILLDSKSQPTVQLCDFGFSRLMGGCNFTTHIGTPQYMAPQNSMKHGNGYCGMASDVWACGVLLFVMLKGRFPFQHTSAAEDDYHRAFDEVHLEQLKFHWTENPRNAYAIKYLSPECLDLLNRIFELDEGKRITMQEIKGHAWFTTPLTEEYREAMNDILAEQKKLDYLMRRHGEVGLTRQSNVIEALVKAACESGGTPTAQSLALQGEEISLLRLQGIASRLSLTFTASSA